MEPGLPRVIGHLKNDHSAAFPRPNENGNKLTFGRQDRLRRLLRVGAV
jgi:hypothetical protein